MTYDNILILTRVITGAALTFIAILLWSKTRDPAWLCIIIGTLFLYAEIVYTTMETFGIIGSGFASVYGFPVFKMFLVNLPMICYAIGFILAIVNKQL
ncbi:MAG: hypothetical protein JW881_18025 [Spirochaetales bacterium]|nr:hypothetical protein [Spirochaetales bacterium]